MANEDNPSRNALSPDNQDGVITILVTEEVPPMADPVDLPSNVAAQLMAESVTNGLANSQNARNVSTAALGVLQAAMARNFDELGAVESRSTSGLVATPLASPTTSGS